VRVKLLWTRRDTGLHRKPAARESGPILSAQVSGGADVCRDVSIEAFCIVPVSVDRG